jgi:hypothetical protein
MMGLRAAALLAAIALASCTTVGPRAPSSGEIARPADFHRDLDSFLARHVDAEGRVDYRTAQRDRADLDRYVALLARVSPDSHADWFPDAEDQLAYWINAYNASVLHLVLHAYPIASVRDVRPPAPLFFLPRVAGFFVFQRVTLGGEDIGLYDLENELIRRRFGEPRIHFALNCASLSCPRLPNRAFRPATLEAELEREARRFLAEARNAAVDVGEQRLRLSSIFDWYESDFVDWMKTTRPAEEPSLRGYVLLYLPQHRAEALRACTSCRVEFTPYDWGLNDRTPAGAD